MSQHISEELKKMTDLFRDSQFCAGDLAKNQEAAYYTTRTTGSGFLPANSDTSTVERSLKEEKIATNIAAFYAWNVESAYCRARKVDVP